MKAIAELDTLINGFLAEHLEEIGYAEVIGMFELRVFQFKHAWLNQLNQLQMMQVQKQMEEQMKNQQTQQGMGEILGEDQDKPEPTLN